ncbi:arrestin domain-containing protein 17-like [Athalia rosae]|uniref:arrestin domain-containing protein 17-like n=1 Tax=Athalia rosae TaxID=37344 RepID=UPI002034835B|nr:arrestin domain-containing protein 17-like [Athalia rosae]
MGFTEFRIILDSPIYYAGQTITGKLIVKLKKPKKLKGLYLKYFGKGTVQWTEGWGTSMVTFSNEEIYLMENQLIFGNETGESELSEGRHVFNFNCQLPNDLPCSFEEVFGKIRYSVRATIDRPWKSEYVVKERLTVMSIFDLNTCALAGNPFTSENSKTFWGHPNSLSMTAKIPVRGFVPGQTIRIKVTLRNRTDVQVKSLSTSLKQNLVFHSPRKSNPSKLSLFKTDHPIDNGYGDREFVVNVRIPALPPSYLQFCNIIDLRYQLNVYANVSGVHRNLKVPMEIIIGNVPLMTYETPCSGGRIIQALINPGDSSCSGISYSTEPPPYSVVFPGAVDYPDFEPPSYEQSVSRLALLENEDQPENSEADGRGSNFSPLYPVYEFGTAK